MWYDDTTPEGFCWNFIPTPKVLHSHPVDKKTDENFLGHKSNNNIDIFRGVCDTIVKNDSQSSYWEVK